MKLGRLTIRARLTLVYGGLFLVAGALLLAVTYLLVDRRLPTVYSVSRAEGQASGATSGTLDGSIVIGGATVPIDDLPEHLRSTTLTSLLAQGGLALALMSCIALAIGWLIAGRALDPLHRITGAARRIAAASDADRGLHERIDLVGPHDEVRELADTLNAMLERLDQAFDGQGRFVANASHELRTPLTLSRSLIEVAIRRRTASNDTRRLGEVLLEINDRSERLLDGLLTLARSGAEPTSRSYVDLADIVEHVVELVTAEAARADVAVTSSTTEAPVLGDAVLLERMVQNLVHNAVRHNVAEQGWARVATRISSVGSVELVVTNTGPIVAPHDVPSLFEPFRRLDGTRLAATPGAGLGLSIVASVARAHSGVVRAEPRDGGGLIVTVTLPVST